MLLQTVFLMILQKTILGDTIYDTNFLFTAPQDISLNYWRDGDISLFFFQDYNSTVFYNYSTYFYSNNQPSNHTLASFQDTNISNQDSLLYLLYENEIQIFSYDVVIDSTNMQFTLNKNVMNIANRQYFSFTNVTDMLLFHLISQDIQLYSDSHRIEAQLYYVFFNDTRDFNETLAKIQDGSLRIYIYMPFVIENPLETIDLNLGSLQNEFNLHSEQTSLLSSNNNLLAYSNNYSLFYYDENQTVYLVSDEMDQTFNIYLPYDSNQIIGNKTGSFIYPIQGSINDNINMIITVQSLILFFQASFTNDFFNLLGSITISDSFSFDSIVDSPADDLLTIILTNDNYPDQYFFLRIEKDEIFQSSTTFHCEICSYFNFYSCQDQSQDCSIVLQNSNTVDNNSMFKVWLSVLIAVFSALILIVICCFLVQRYCIRGPKKPQGQIINYDEVEERLKGMDKKKLGELMKKYSVTMEENDMENSHKFKAYVDNKCPICMELLPSEPITYFSCKTHIVHTRCFILYEEENRNHSYKCPFRCTEEKK